MTRKRQHSGNLKKKKKNIKQKQVALKKVVENYGITVRIFVTFILENVL